MTDIPIRLTLQVIDPNADPEQLDELARELSRTVSTVDHDGLRATVVAEGEVADDLLSTRTTEQTVGLVVAALASSKVLIAVIKAVETWIAGRQSRRVEIQTADGSVVIVTGRPNQEQEAALKLLIDHIAIGDRGTSGDQER